MLFETGDIANIDGPELSYYCEIHGAAMGNEIEVQNILKDLNITPYTLSAVKTLELTNDSLIDINTSGSFYRSNTDNPIYYGVSHGHYGEKWRDIEAVSNRLQTVMEQFSDFSGIELVHAGSFESPNAAARAGVTVVFTQDYFVSKANPESEVIWLAYHPHSDENNYGADNIGGNLYMSMNAPVWEGTDQAGFEKLLLESDVGFAFILEGMRCTLGLKDPDTESNGRPHIENTHLSTFTGNVDYSISFITPDISDEDVHTSLGIMDVLTLNYLYGQNTNTNSGDTLHDLSTETLSHMEYTTPQELIPYLLKR